LSSLGYIAYGFKYFKDGQVTFYWPSPVESINFEATYDYSLDVLWWSGAIGVLTAVAELIAFKILFDYVR